MSATATGSAVPRPDSPPLSDELRALGERQDAMEFMLVLLAAKTPDIGGLIGTVEAMRDAMSTNDPPRMAAADALDSINKTLKMVKKAREARLNG